LAQSGQERLAASCAAEMVRAARRLAEQWRQRTGPPLAIGVGIATRDAVVGTIGSDELRAYAAIGDTLNLASRLEGRTKDLGVPVVLDEATTRACELRVREVGEITVKGRAVEVRVDTLTGLDGVQ
jgi:adenylate cyclase